ncbi:mannosyltransferase family protein [Patescibacteria group bacterium]
MNQFTPKTSDRFFLRVYGRLKSSFPFQVFLLFQVVVTLIFLLAPKIFPSSGQFMFADQSQKPAWLWNRANFDGVHFFSIAQNGYGLYQQAFFPLYPLVTRFLGRFLGGQSLLAGWLVSFFSLGVGLEVFFRLLKVDWPEKTAQQTILFLLFFPTSFFFSLIYSESLFFLLAVSTIYLARKKHWFWALVTCALATATRLQGISLIPTLIFLFYQSKKRTKKDFVKVIGASLGITSLGSLGFLGYLFYLNSRYGDPLLFAHVQPFFGANRSSGKLILLYQVFWRYLKMITTLSPNNWLYFIVWLEFGVAIFFLTLLLLALKKKKFWSYLVFAWPSFLLPTLTGTFSSLPRYVLMLFPGFIMLALQTAKRPILKRAYFVLSLGLFLICQTLFALGYWVS